MDTVRTATEDLTGRDRMSRNVLSGWAGQLVAVVAGFVTPRMIDRYIGQVALGVWDLCWSLVSYFNLAYLGTGASVDRYVAKYQASADVQGVRRAVSSVMCVQIAGSVLVATMTVAAIWSLSWLFGRKLGPDTELASLVLALLGAGLTIQVALNAFRGVITGCHRWGVHNGINASFEMITTVAIILVLAMGGGLRQIAMAYLGAVVLAELARVAAAYRVYPKLRISLAYAEWAQTQRMLLFGAKSSLSLLSTLLLLQGNKIIVAAFLGVGPLAVYSRAASLVRHVAAFADKFAFVLKPTASSLQGAAQDAELRELLITTTRYAAYLTLPMITVLTILDDAILRLWMGPSYEQGWVLPILALGHALPLVQQPASGILAGLNLHGWLGIARFATALCSIGLGVITVGFLQWDLIGAALSVALPLLVGNGLFIAIYACRRLGVPVTEYVRRALGPPIACAIPFGFCLASIRMLSSDPLTAVSLSGIAIVVLVGPLYWWRYAAQVKLLNTEKHSADRPRAAIDRSVGS